MLADMWDLNEDDAARSCSSTFEREWRRETHKESPSLIKAFFRAFGFDFVMSGFFKAVQDVLGFARFSANINWLRNISHALLTTPYLAIYPWS
jgi:hypothetical protein